MNNRLYFLFCLSCMFGFGLASFGQDLTNNPAIQEQIFSVFEELDLSSSQVNTGYLLDRAVDF